jgi:hypothetical protein
LQDEAEDDGVVSRLHMSDEQRQLKEKFEDKQREEARRIAKEEKLAHKRVCQLYTIVIFLEGHSFYQAKCNL